MEHPETKGPLTLAELLGSRWRELPKAPGVYFVMAPKRFKRQFIIPGTGGWFKGKDPNVDLATLKRHWIPRCTVLYIGKAQNLRKRVQSLLQFGQGKAVAHWGGRLLWQIRNSHKFLLEWYEHPSPLEEERRLRTAFKQKHGRLPFANLQE